MFSLRDGLVFECKDEGTETKKPFDKDKADADL